jgi:glutamate racemase
MFVPLVEEGRDSNDPIVRMAVAAYMKPLRVAGARVVVMGCTHYPLLRDALEEYFDGEAHLIDSGCEAARVVEASLRERNALHHPSKGGSLRAFVSDNPTRFERVGSRFLSEPIGDVEMVDAGRYVGLAPRLDVLG